jgi:hypothetical protein
MSDFDKDPNMNLSKKPTWNPDKIGSDPHSCLCIEIACETARRKNTQKWRNHWILFSVSSELRTKLSYQNASFKCSWKFEIFCKIAISWKLIIKGSVKVFHSFPFYENDTTLIFSLNRSSNVLCGKVAPLIWKKTNIKNKRIALKI